MVRRVIERLGNCRLAGFYTEEIRLQGSRVGFRATGLGGASTVVLGDYIAGPSHALPTGGTARFGSPLNITDFIKLINTVTIDEDNLKQLGKAAALLARAEGLEAHARAVEKRLKPE